jgi:hypothetical protein
MRQMRKAEIISEEDALAKTYEVKEHMHNYARIIVPHSLVGKTVKLVPVRIEITII